MKKLFLLTFMFTLLFSQSGLAAEEKWELNHASGMVESHPLMIASYKFFLYPEIEKRSQGRIKINYFAPNTLCPEFEVYPSLLKGVVDLGMQMTERSPIPMPYMSAFTLPGLFRNAMSIHIVPQIMLDKHAGLQKELAQFKVIEHQPVIPNGFAMRTSQIKTLDDVKGKRILVAGSAGTNMITTLGGTPIVMAATEFYLALQRGMADGCLMPAGVYRAMKINEVAPFYTQAFTTSTASINMMSKKLWDSFPKDIQDSLDPLFGMPANLKIGMMQQTLDNIMQVQLKNEGSTIYALSDEELAKWRLAYEPLYTAWVTDMEKKGYKDAKEFLAEVMSLADIYNKEENYLKLYAEHQDIIGTPDEAKQIMIKIMTPQPKQ